MKTTSKPADSKPSSNITVFLDLLFNFLLGFVMMFIILLAIIRVDAAKPAVEDKNEFIITMTWTEGEDNDVDLWIKGPTGKVVGFRQREGDGMFLQRDDLGNTNDFFIGTDGKLVIVPLNQEIINIRKIIPGTYVVNAHFFRSRGKQPEVAEFKLIKINPYSEVVTTKVELPAQGVELTAIVFEVLEDGTVRVLPTVQQPVALQDGATQFTQ
jgi:hypothetical protein